MTALLSCAAFAMALRSLDCCGSRSALVACAGVGLSDRSNTNGPEDQFAVKDRANCGDVTLPPARFDHAATIPIFIRKIPFENVNRECREHRVDAPRMAFSLGPRGMSTVALLSQFTHGDFETKACSWTFARLGFVVLPESGKAGVSET